MAGPQDAMIQQIMAKVLGKPMPGTPHALTPNQKPTSQRAGDIAYDQLSQNKGVEAFGGDASMNMVQEMAQLLDQAGLGNGSKVDNQEVRDFAYGEMMPQKNHDKYGPEDTGAALTPEQVMQMMGEQVGAQESSDPMYDAAYNLAYEIEQATGQKVNQDEIYQQLVNGATPEDIMAGLSQ